MATALSSRIVRLSFIVAAVAVIAAVAAQWLTSAGSSASPVAGPASRHVAAVPRAGFMWLVPQAAPAGWRVMSTASGGATLFSPPGWVPTPGDPGTVSAALRDRHGLYAGYLNATPRDGRESLRGWARFRLDHNREEGVTHAHQVAAAEGLRFRNARGSCVIDDYLSRGKLHPYREIACIVAGHRNTEVFVGATLISDWPTLGSTVEHAASAFLVR